MDWVIPLIIIGAVVAAVVLALHRGGDRARSGSSSDSAVAGTAARGNSDGDRDGGGHDGNAHDGGGGGGGGDGGGSGN